jgi:3-phenylpropionate/trans-cinnamate dioxygenase ferredoxin reductase component
VSDHVIVGASLAGAKAAEALRAEGHDGRIVLIGAEPDLPYERPPLSKDHLRGESPAENARVHPESWYAENDVELRLGTTVERVDPHASEVILAGGERIAYDRLLLTTGAAPRRLRVPGSDLDDIFYLRDMRDSDALAARLKQGGRLAVVGGGWIGAEVAASARQLGVDVTLIEMESLPLERVLGSEVARSFADLHTRHGVRLVTEATVAGFEGGAKIERVLLEGGENVDADFVVVGVGVSPRVQLANDAGIATDNGILVNAALETSVPRIYAAGDVANAEHPFYGRRLRVEHWANALNQPQTAAKAMLGKPASYDELPFFFSDQYDTGLEYRGFAERWDHVVFRGDPASGEFVAFYVDGGRVAAALNVNVWDVGDAVEEMIRSRRPVDDRELAEVTS